MMKFNKIVKRIGAFVLAGVIAVTGIPFTGLSSFGGVTYVKKAEAASVTSRLPLWCYMKNSSGVLYTYTDQNLQNRTGYIEPGDYCKIINMYSNGVVYVEYPTARGKRKAFAASSGFFAL